MHTRQVRSRVRCLAEAVRRRRCGRIEAERGLVEGMTWVRDDSAWVVVRMLLSSGRRSVQGHHSFMYEVVLLSKVDVIPEMTEIQKGILVSESWYKQIFFFFFRTNSRSLTNSIQPIFLNVAVHKDATNTMFGTGCLAVPLLLCSSTVSETNNVFSESKLVLL